MSALNHLKVDVPSLSPLGSIYVYDPLIISPSDAVPTIETDKALGAVATPVIGIAIVTAELSLVPFAFTALTLKLYDNPFVRPVTVIGDEPVAVILPGEDIAVYVVAAPPVAPAVYDTDTSPDAPVERAVPIVGACGFVDGVIEEDTDDADEVLKLFVAVIENV